MIRRRSELGAGDVLHRCPLDLYAARGAPSRFHDGPPALLGFIGHRAFHLPSVLDMLVL